MITEKPFLHWYKTKCYIEDGTIYEINYKDRKGYLADKATILEEFAKIDESNLEDIKDFVCNYGFLRSEFAMSGAKLGYSYNDKDNWISVSTYSEELDFFIKQVGTIKALRVLHSVFTSNSPLKTLVNEGSIIQWDFQILSKLMQATNRYLDFDVETKDMKIKNITFKHQEYIPDMEYSTRLNYYNENNIKTDAGFILTKILNNKIKDIHPILSLNPNLDKINNSWQTNSLLEIIYIHYYTTISGGHELRMCANDRCTRDKYFTALVGKEKEYCSSKCAMQGMQNSNYKEIRDSNSDKYFLPKVEFDGVYRRLYYLHYRYNSIDKKAFDIWNKEARKKLRDIKDGTLTETAFIEWLKETGNKENFILGKKEDL